MDSAAPDFFAWLKLPPSHIGFLQGIVASSLRGLERDLQRSERLPNPDASRRDFAAYTRILEGLERGYMTGPDEDAHQILSRLIADTDAANSYSAVIAEHDALQGMIHQLEGRQVDGS